MKDPIAAALLRPPVQLDPRGVRSAAVALVFGPTSDGSDALLLIRRAEKAGDPWSGHIGLPGGHVESGETFVEAAVREAREEVGIDLSDARLLGELDDCATPAMIPSRLVRPFVFRVPAFGPFDLQASEVAAAGIVPLEVLLAGEGRGTFPYDHQGRSWTLPCIDLPDGRLWGMTLRMVDDLLHRLDGRGMGLDRPTSQTRGKVR